MILSMDGRTLAKRKILPLTFAQVKWFVHGPTFLRRAGDLYALSLGLVCSGCTLRGLTDDVKVLDDPDTQTWKITCAHRGRLSLPYDGTPSATDELMSKLGFTLKCLDCARRGMADGVDGGNDQSDARLSISCGCSERIYQMANGGRA